MATLKSDAENKGGIVSKAINQSDNKLNMFGSSHDVLGSSSSDLILKTRGKVKIQWGNKFIDLLKDGKLNIDTNFIFKVADKDAINNKIGLYVTNDDSVYLKLKSEDPINLTGEIGTTYVSFLEEQETSSDNKHTALKNVGFLYSDIKDITEDSLKNGIIYIESELKLYCVKDGVLSEFVCNFPNPYTKQFIISKNDEKEGALVIKGEGIENSIAFDTMLIYSSATQSIFNSSFPFSFKYKDITVLDITKLASTFSNDVISDTFQSPNYSLNSGFKLYNIQGKSILEVDEIVERYKNDYKNYPEYWILDNNVIANVKEDVDLFRINFVYPHDYEVNDILRFYKNEKDEDLGELYLKLVLVKITHVLNLYSILVECNDKISTVTNVVSFKVYPGTLIRIKENNADIIRYKNEDGELIEEKIISRFGNLNDLMSFEKEEDGFGLFSNIGIFKQAEYTGEYVVPLTDRSFKFASTDWVKTYFETEIQLYYTKTEIDEKLGTTSTSSISTFSTLNNKTTTNTDIEKQISNLTDLITLGNVSNPIVLISGKLEKNSINTYIFNGSLNLNITITTSINNEYISILLNSNIYNINITGCSVTCDKNSNTDFENTNNNIKIFLQSDNEFNTINLIIIGYLIKK